MSGRVNDFLDRVVTDGVNAVSPREGFAAELLLALKEMPVLPVPNDSSDSHLQPRWILPGAVAGTLGAVGAVWFGITLRNRRRSIR